MKELPQYVKYVSGGWDVDDCIILEGLHHNVITRFGNASYNAFCSFVLECILQIHQLLFFWDADSIAHWHAELFAKVLPSHNTTMEGWQLELGQLNCYSFRCLGRRRDNFRIHFLMLSRQSNTINFSTRVWFWLVGSSVGVALCVASSVLISLTWSLYSSRILSSSVSLRPGTSVSSLLFRCDTKIFLPLDAGVTRRWIRTLSSRYRSSPSSSDSWLIPQLKLSSVNDGELMVLKVLLQVL